MKLAVSAFADTAFHPPLEAEPDVALGDALAQQLHQHEAVHHRRADDDRHSVAGVNLHLLEQGRDHTDVSLPGVVGTIYGEMKLDIAAGGPLRKFILEQKVGGRARPIQDCDAPILAAIIEHLIDQGAQRRQPKPARGKQQILAPEALEGETTPERTTDAEEIAWVQAVERAGNVSHPPDAQFKLAIATAGEEVTLIGASDPKHETSTNCRAGD
jgi:hypothetical protein